MSKIITDLIGKTCKITKLDEMSFIEKTKILEVDEDWIKLEKTDKKNINSIEIIRIDDVKKIEEVVE